VRALRDRRSPNRSPRGAHRRPRTASRNEFFKIPQFGYVLGASQHSRLRTRIVTRPRPIPSLADCLSTCSPLTPPSPRPRSGRGRVGATLDASRGSFARFSVSGSALESRRRAFDQTEMSSPPAPAIDNQIHRRLSSEVTLPLRVPPSLIRTPDSAATKCARAPRSGPWRQRRLVVNV
jgi:hypothetical protein